MNDAAPLADSPAAPHAAPHAAAAAASPAASAGTTRPQGLPAYRLLTGPDDSAFCRRVSEALALGYRLHGSPAATFNGTQVIVAQAVLWPGAA